ncbi:MAG: prolipoprotein diacylglyceryl transferase family protein [Planctomycetota bacterium]
MSGWPASGGAASAAHAALTAAGVAAVFLAARREGGRSGISPAVFDRLLAWAGLGGLVGARVWHCVAYEPERYLARPLDMLRVWEPGSGFFGALVAAASIAVVYAWRTGVPPASLLGAAFYGLPLGQAIGRVGCALVGDCRGRPTAGWWGVAWPDGVVRHDVARYEALLGAVTFAAFVGLRRRWPALPTERFVAMWLVIYGGARLALDELRVEGAAAAWTPSQWAAAAALLLGASAALACGVGRR